MRFVCEKTKCGQTQNSKDDGKKDKEPHIVAHKEGVGYGDKTNTLKNEIVVTNVQHELVYIVKPSIDSFDLFSSAT